MDIQLKKITTNLKFSEETTMFQGTLYVDGKPVGYCENHGHGGNTSISPMKQGDREILDKCETYCKSLPDEDGLKMDLEFYVDMLLEKHLLQKDFKKGLLVKLNGETNIVSWKGIKFTELLSNKKHWKTLKDTITEYKNKGYEILNDNIPDEVTR